jgi:hypothetical protein
MSVISDIIQAGIEADLPTLTTYHEGYLYFATDTETLYRWDGAAWVQVAAPAAGGATFIEADGSVAFTGDQSMGGNQLTNVGDPGSAQDAATKAYVDGLAANLGKRARVRAATTANITIATALNNADTLDGVTLATGDLVLVKDQSSGAENGVYVVGVSPARAAEFDSYDEHPGSLIAVQEGTANADTLWLCTSNVGGTIGVTAIVFTAFTVSAGNIEDQPTAETNTSLRLAPDGAGGVEWAAGGGGGALVQRVQTQTGAVATGTTVIPIDDTIPQNTEGDEYMTLAITPTDAANILYIRVTAWLVHSANITWLIGALFKDSDANALAAMAEYGINSGGSECVTFTHKMTAGTTSAITFKFRAGGNNAGTMTFNGTGGARFLGGVIASSIEIDECTP